MFKLRILTPSTLRQRLSFGVMALTAASVAFVAVAGVIAAFYASEVNQAATVSERLGRLQVILQEAREQIAVDARTLANTPSVQGFIGSGEILEKDQQDASADPDYWRHRVEQVFESFLDLRPNYLQIRLISSDTGFELARIDRHNSGEIVATPRNALQDKSGEFYFQIARNLEDTQAYLTEPSWNRENGIIETPKTAVSRMIVPVFDTSNTRRGFLIINIDTTAHKKRILDNFSPMGTVILAYSKTKAFVYDAETKHAQMYLDNDAKIPSDLIFAMQNPESSTGILRAGQKITSHQILESTTTPDYQEILALISDHIPLFGLIGRISFLLAILGATMTLAASFLVWKFVSNQLRPFVDLKDEINRAEATNAQPILPIQRTDEVGEISRAFDTLLQTVAAREERLRILFNGVRDGIVLAAETGRIFASNPSLNTMFGYDPDELIGKDIGTLMTNSERLDHSRVISKHMRTGSITRIGRTTIDHAQRKDGSHFDIELSVSRLDNRNETYFAAVIRDVSERSQAEAEKEKLIDALRHSNEELDSFAYVASHDLKAPLRAIATASTWLVDDLAGKLDPDTQETFDMMRNRVSRMTQLLDGLLEHSQIGRKTGDTESPILNGNELASEICALVNPPPTFTIEFSDAFLALELRQLPLRTVLLNLISNAIKHHDRSDGTVWIDGQKDDAWITFSVKDDGPGIAPEFHDRVFQLFQTLRSRDRVEGTGLGLAICRKQVRHMGGELTLQSDGEGNGTLFSFTWPASIEGTQANAA